MRYDESDRACHGGVPFTGEVEYTDADGRVIALAGYLSGLRDGTLRTWYPDGTPRSQGPGEESAEAAFELAASERAAGRVDAARAAFLRAVATGDPEVGPKALANLAVLEASAGRVAQARAAFEQAIATGHPDHAPKSLFNYAIFQQRNGELAHARELYEQAVADGHPEHARKARFNLANLAVDQGRVSEACGLFLRAMEPPFHGDTAQRAHRRLIEVDSGRLAEACEVYVRAIADATASADQQTVRQARGLLRDLDPQYGQAERTINVGNRTFAVAEIESAEWAMGRPRYGSGYIDVYTRDGQQHTVFVDPGDPYDSRGLSALRELLGPGNL
ncbi:tetratricopeptide repeat protein [Kitasatospora sp. NPDC008050]|uniref:tetratricopeptide repeat protein n=1 Tax=Kitasatospora sp. NPDC008050 TaxID=3364021 RepID=UPI0036E15C8A